MTFGNHNQALAIVFLVSAACVAAQAPPPPAAPGRGGAGAAPQRVQPPARIMSFSAEPATVKAGESVLLTWATENPSGLTIEPGVGRVTPRGTTRVPPTTTTTYTLSINGPNGAQATKTVTVNVAGT